MSTSTVQPDHRTVIGNASQSAIALGVFRIVVALMFMVHGSSKLFGFPDGTPVAFGAWPMWWAGILELALGALLALGLFTRVAAFFASGTMAVAYFWRHFPDSFWPTINGGETAALYCLVFLLLVFAGPGALAVSRRW